MGALSFAADPDDEHDLILAAKAKAEGGAWELGARLIRFQEVEGWKRVTRGTGAPYSSFTDYLERGTGLDEDTQFSYMKAATLPKEVTDRIGIKGATMLAKICELTDVTETMEEALELEVIGDDGNLKRFVDMTTEERQRAYSKVRLESGAVRPGNKPRGPTAGSEMRDRLRELLKPYLKSGQIQVRRVDGQEVLDFKGMRAEHVQEILELMSKALNH